MGLKRGAIGSTLGEHIGNMLGTKEKGKKILPHPSHPKVKRKQTREFECMMSLPIGCMKFLFPKPFVTILKVG
jgi:hypothetical protein